MPFVPSSDALAPSSKACSLIVMPFVPSSDALAPSSFLLLNSNALCS